MCRYMRVIHTGRLPSNVLDDADTCVCNTQGANSLQVGVLARALGTSTITSIEGHANTLTGSGYNGAYAYSGMSAQV